MSYPLAAGLIIVSAVLFGLQPWYGAELAGGQVDVNGMMLIRFALPALVVGAWLALTARVIPLTRAWPHALLGVAFAFTGIGYYQAGYQIGFSLAVILFYSFPVLVTLYSAMALKKTLQPVQWLAVATATLGLLLAVDVPPNIQAPLAGVLWALLSACCYAFVLTFKSHYAPPVSEPISLLLLTLGATVTVLAYGLWQGISLPATGVEWQWTLTLAIFAGLVPIALIMLGSPRTGATDSATYCLIEPIVAVWVASHLAAEDISLRTLIGGALVVLAALVLIRFRSNRQGLSATAEIAQ